MLNICAKNSVLDIFLGSKDDQEYRQYKYEYLQMNLFKVYNYLTITKPFYYFNLSKLTIFVKKLHHRCLIEF